MPDNGSGTYSLPQAAFIAGATISSTAVNANFSDMATALNNRMTRNGESAPSGNVPMGTFRHTNVGNAVARTEYATAGQIADGALVWGGTSTGSANVQAISPTPGVPAYVAGARFLFLAGFSNTAAWTLAVSGLAATAVLGAVVAGQLVDVVFDGTAFRMVLPPQGAITANMIVNGGFRYNQRAQVSGGAKAAGVYMHDRWKAGASGGTYTFTQSGGPFTVVTVTAGSIVQAIEGFGIGGGAYTLTWEGTATAKLNGGTAAASPIIATLPANTNATVEFLTGTVGKVQLALGGGQYQPLLSALEFVLCQRYYTVIPLNSLFLASAASQAQSVPFHLPVTMRATPTVVLSVTGSVTNAFSVSVVMSGAAGGRYELTSGTSGYVTANDRYYAFDAEI